MLSQTSCGTFCKSATMALSKTEQTMLFFINEVSRANRNRICNACSRVSLQNLSHCMSAYTSPVEGNASENLTGPLRLAALLAPKEDTLGCVMDFLDETSKIV